MICLESAINNPRRTLKTAPSGTIIDSWVMQGCPLTVNTISTIHCDTHTTTDHLINSKKSPPKKAELCWAMFSLESSLPLMVGSFCSSRFLLRLNRDELCRRSFFTIWGPPEYLILLSWVGGGVLLLGRLLAVCWAWGKKPHNVQNQNGHIIPFYAISPLLVTEGQTPVPSHVKHNQRNKNATNKKKAILLSKSEAHSGEHFIGETFG